MHPNMDPRTALFDAELAEKVHGGGHNGYGSHDFKQQQLSPTRSKSLLARKHLNACGLVQVLAVPISLFVGTFYIMSFRLQFHFPNVAIALVGLAFVCVLVIGAAALYSQKKENSGGERTWLLVMFYASVAACVAGPLLGYINYSMNTHYYYEYISLRKIVDVDPGRQYGQQLLDAGEIQFKRFSSVDKTLNGAWHKGTIYCVAPIIGADQSKLASYDFWAVGKDCCSARTSDYGCGDGISAWTNNPPPPAGIRVINDADSAGYKLALEQAVAKYNIPTSRPIFLNMMKSPYQKIRSYMMNAQIFATVSCLLFIVIHGGIVGWQTHSAAKEARSEGWAY